ncbi:MAG: hypothetical protein GF383_03045 [Candidatus Lokiarchaeota archaeon]|nr:hypothetical protein [Candidatus Lokiarchaeota archaeon]MBD3338516.1 hypothetical protein [Candidatus Lokiarchaeota archaeon]
MSKKDLSDDELEEELDRAFKKAEGQKDKCGTAIPTNREIGIQRDNVKLKKE